MGAKITSENLKSYKSSDLPLAVNLWATRYGPCRMMRPVISELVNNYNGKIAVGKYDAEENDDIAMQSGIRDIPTILPLKGGELVDKLIGTASRAILDKKLKVLL